MIKNITNDNGELIGYDIRLDVDAIGHDVRDHLVELQNIYSYFASDVDILAYEVDNIKLIIEETEVNVDEILVKKYPLKKKFTKKDINTTKVLTKFGKEFSLFELKSMLNDTKFKYSIAKSKLKELESSINTARSVLSFDRIELEKSVS